MIRITKLNGLVYLQATHSNVKPFNIGQNLANVATLDRSAADKQKPHARGYLGQSLSRASMGRFTGRLALAYGL